MHIDSDPLEGKTVQVYICIDCNKPVELATSPC